MVLALVVGIFTARLAVARGKNPWTWGVGAVILGIPWPTIGLPLLGIVPVLFLMFFVRPIGQDSRPRQAACSRCASPHSPGQNFCTKCGWDLSREYSPEGGDTVLASEMHQSQAASTATMERPVEPATPEEPTAATPPSADPPDPQTLEEPSDDARGVAPGPAADTEEAVVVGEPGADAEPEPDQRPWGIPQPGPAPTAAVMTARGEALLNEGRLQEAIDQFTKAIALDPKHREAFERRAEAYTKQGRDERAEEDYRRIQALNTGA